VRSNARDVRSNVHCTACLKQGRALARRGVSGERRYATVLEKAAVRSIARPAFDHGCCAPDFPETQQKPKTGNINANLIFFLNFIYTKAQNK
jgi:hypothetical protein